MKFIDDDATEEQFQESDELYVNERMAHRIFVQNMIDANSRQEAISALADYIYNVDKLFGMGTSSMYNCKKAATSVFEELPPVQPDNQTNLCDSCDYLYPDCPSKNDDVIFGNGIGNDNICACNKYNPSAQRWIPCSEKLPKESGRYLVTRGLNACGELWNRVYIINYSDLMGLKSERIWWDGNVGKSDFERIDDVIAWMQLPKPYTERREIR